MLRLVRIHCRRQRRPAADLQVQGRLGHQIGRHGRRHEHEQGDQEFGDAGAALGDRTSMVHRSTAVTAGRGRFIVTAVGLNSRTGEREQSVR